VDATPELGGGDVLQEEDRSHDAAD